MGRERALREQADILNDDDIEQLIIYLNSGGSLTGGIAGLAPIAAAKTVATNGRVAQANNNADLSEHFI